MDSHTNQELIVIIRDAMRELWKRKVNIAQWGNWVEKVRAFGIEPEDVEEISELETLLTYSVS